jgi:hypothetical protein
VVLFCQVLATLGGRVWLEEAGHRRHVLKDIPCPTSFLYLYPLLPVYHDLSDFSLPHILYYDVQPCLSLTAMEPGDHGLKPLKL